MNFTGLKRQFALSWAVHAGGQWAVGSGQWAVGSGQCSAQRPVICAAGLHVQFWGGGVGVEVRD